MDKQKLDETLGNAGLPAVEEIIGRKFIFSYQDRFTEIPGIIGGTITGVLSVEPEPEAYLLGLFVSVPEIWDGRIDVLIYDKKGWILSLKEPSFERAMEARKQLGYLRGVCEQATEQYGEFQLI